MPNVVVVGTQWGDEGKGKIVDVFTEFADIVVRFQGGNNAGHTLVIDGKRTVLHLIPSGVMTPDVLCVIGNGVVVDPEVCLEEIRTVKKKGFLKRDDLLAISENAHLILPYHKRIDLLREERRGANRIGTTGRGIGPCYEDKMGRMGIRFCEFAEPELFRKRLEAVLPEKNHYIEKILRGPTFRFDEIYEPYAALARELKRYCLNTTVLLKEAIRKKKNILFEGAQGTSLDVDHGTYPYVTSSNTVAGNACSGSGVGPTAIDQVVGISKAYTTRVGEGPFPTELNDDVGRKFQQEGREFGATTGRPRRCGWIDLVVIRHAAHVNGLTGLVMTKLDILSGLEKIKLCVAYRHGNRTLTEFPGSLSILQSCEPIYEEMKGWKEPLTGIKSMKKLPAAVRNYLKCIERFVGVPIVMISLGHSREQHIFLKNPFR